MQQSTLGEFSLTPEQIAGDYFEGERAYQQHLKLLECAQAGMKPVDYAKATGVTRTSNRKEYATRFEVMGRFLEGRYPAAIQALVALQSLGILEGKESGQFFDPNLLKTLNMDSKRFELLTMLSAFGFWTGSLSSTVSQSKPNKTSKDLMLSYRDMADPEAISIVDDFISQLKEDGICTPHEKKTEKRNGRIVAPATRLIFLMNGLIGKKSQSNLAFPEIFERAIKSINEPVSQEERTKALRILRDFMLAFFVIRTTYRPEHGHCGWIVAHEDEGVATQRRDLFEETLKASGFEHGQYKLSPEKNIYDEGRRSSNVTRVTFPGMQKKTVADIRQEFSDRMDAVINT